MSRTNWKKEFIDWYSELVNYDDLKKEDKAHFNEMKKILGGMPDYFHMFYDKSVKDGEDPAKYIEFKNKADVRALTEDLRAAVRDKDPQKMRMAMTNVFRGGMPKDLDAAQSITMIFLKRNFRRMRWTFPRNLRTSRDAIKNI